MPWNVWLLMVCGRLIVQTCTVYMSVNIKSHAVYLMSCLIVYVFPVDADGFLMITTVLQVPPERGVDICNSVGIGHVLESR